VFALLRDAGVIDDPGHDGLLAGHGRQHLPHDGGQHGLVAPRCRAHQVLERLPRRLDAACVFPGSLLVSISCSASRETDRNPVKGAACRYQPCRGGR
jgi:hypothetical protein